uniref:hypothetical protein n=1 Tax=Phocaeicola vulgatus TaxID=821 RepID=UPI003FF068D7
MGFTTPCFIRKNTQELRRGLEELGYEILNSGNTTLDAHNYDGNGSHKSIEEGRAIITSYGNLYGVIYDIDTVTKKGRIDCGTNEELFLAIAALRDDTDKNQWFTDGDKWILCPEIKFSTYWVYNDIDVNIDTVHKATVDELIEHFKTKKEQ